MKVSCLQENLNKGLGIVGRAVATRTTLPITSHVLVATDDGRLKLAATNLEIALSCWIGAQVEEEGAITIPARLLIDFVNSLPNERIDLTLAARSRPARRSHAEAEQGSPRTHRGHHPGACPRRTEPSSGRRGGRRGDDVQRRPDAGARPPQERRARGAARSGNLPQLRPGHSPELDQQ